MNELPINIWRKMIAEGETEQVLKAMEISGAFSTNEITLLLNRWGKLRKSMIEGIESSDMLRRIETEINKSILTLFETVNYSMGRLEKRSEEDKKKPSVLLASTSPRRKKLLSQIGWLPNVDFVEKEPVSYEDPLPKNLSLEEAKLAAIAAARRKINDTLKDAFDNYDLNPAETIVAAFQTYVWCDGEVLSTPLPRPKNFADAEDFALARERAKATLNMLRGKDIHIITGIAVTFGNSLGLNNENVRVQAVITEGRLKDYSDTDIKDYVSTGEPLDKAGAFGIQEKGIFLFDSIKGSYTNIVGLPLREFISLLNLHFSKKIGARFGFKHWDQPKTDYHAEKSKLSIVCAGDINYDFIHNYDTSPEDFFSHKNDINKKLKGVINKAAGGTAVQFAKGAKDAGFEECWVVGTYGRDPLGDKIFKELSEYRNGGIKFAFQQDLGRETGVSIILRSQKENYAITIAHSDQSWTLASIDQAKNYIEKSNIFYCSGYCITDKRREAAAQEMISWAKNAGRLVVVDAVKGMDNEISFDQLINYFTYKDKLGSKEKSVDVFVVEFPEIFRWLQYPYDSSNELISWNTHKTALIERLRREFKVIILRTSNYSHEIIITSHFVSDPAELGYGLQEPMLKLGYSARRTSQQIFDYLSPRIVLASQSEQRLQLLYQIIAPEKIQVVKSSITEEERLETPHERVQRLALAKAEAIFREKNFSKSIEFIIGADTEIITKNAEGEWILVGHPKTAEEAEQCLYALNGKDHYAITGVAVIGKDPKTGHLKRVNEVNSTRVTFAQVSNEDIRVYANTGEPLGKAGAYAIQGLGTLMIDSIEGSYSNVVGLPLEMLTDIFLRKFGKRITDFDKVSNWQFPDPIYHL